MRRRALAYCAVLLCTTHCASMFNGHTQQISVNASVADAEVLLNGQPIGQTPLTIDVARHKSGTLSVRKKGYTSAQLQMSSSWSNAFIWGDIVA